MIFAISSLLTKVIALLSTMLITRLFDEASYATYKQVFLAFTVVLPFLSFGLSHAIFYFLPFEKERIRGRVNDCYFIYFVSGVVFSLFILLGGNKILALRFNNPEVAPLLPLIIPYIIITLLIQCNNAIFNIMNRVKMYMIHTVCSGLFTNITLILVMIFAPSVKNVVLTYVFTQVISGSILLILTDRILPRDEKRISTKSMWEMLRFAIPLGIAGMIGTFSLQLDSLFVTTMSSPEEYAVYTVGAHELIIISVIISSITSAITPRMRLYIAQEKYNECSELFQLSARRMASMLVPMMCFFWVWSDEFITFIYSEKYLASVWIFRVYLLYFLLRIAVSGPVFSALGMGKFILTRSIITCVLNAVFNYIGIKLFGTIGAAIATILSGALVFMFSTAPMLRKKLQMPLIKTYPIKTVSLSLLLGMAGGYATKYFIGNNLMPGLLGWLDLSSLMERLNLSQYFGSEIVSTLEAALALVVNGVIFASIFIVLALLLMKKDYVWIIEKVKEILKIGAKSAKNPELSEEKQ